MSQLRPGLPPERVTGALPRPAALLIGFVSLGIACLGLGACSTTSTTGQPTSYYRAPIAGVGAPIRAEGPPVEIEADGIEAQRPPRRRVHTIPDDPTQPYSPNYGGAPATHEDVYTADPSWTPIVKPASVG